ncbi:unnamed protein product [marine sediment metagenome]|uniref:Uncharacterized protein n=1 Tax=marine sediment metagenome TaxID=412755 RepID=X1STF9_9ZZZZ
MDMDDERIREAVKHTEIVRLPKQSLSTFGTTNIYYYLVTKPAYSELVNDVTETVVREGRVIAEKPKIVTPYYLSRLEGFSSEARKYFETMLGTSGSHAAGLLYSYRNEPKELTIVSEDLLSVVDKLNAEIDKKDDPLTSIIKGEDELWDVSLLKFIYEMTARSVRSNLQQMGARGLLNIDASGVPADARVKIEELFGRVASGESEPRDLKEELDRWGLFEEYQDRFFALFKGKR